MTTVILTRKPRAKSVKDKITPEMIEKVKKDVETLTMAATARKYNITIHYIRKIVNNEFTINNLKDELSGDDKNRESESLESSPTDLDVELNTDNERVDIENTHTKDDKKNIPKYSRKRHYDKHTEENIEKAKQYLKKDYNINYISRETGISIYYVRKLKEGKSIPIVTKNQL
jgi:hypothetical protein